VEEFDRPIDLEKDPIWTWSDGGLIEGQMRFVKEGIKFDDGKMKIEVSNRSYSGVQRCSHAEATEIPPKELSSGEMRSRHNMFRYGRYEARIKAPCVQPGNTRINGNYVATLFVFRDGKYRHWREVDVEITGETVDSVHTNVLSADHTAKWSEDMDEEKDMKVGTNVRAGFHTYAIEWLPHRIRWYFDDKLIREKKTGGKVEIPSLSTKIMMNTWVFDHRAMFGGREIWNDRFPLHTEYDWFRFYKWDGDRHYPCAGLGTQCLTSDDWYLSSNNPCDGIPQKGTVQGKTVCVAKCH
jgi:beta-glucanase (GH16 family)